MSALFRHFFCLAALGVSCPAAVLTVGPGKDHETIGAAVAAAAAEDTLELSPGVFGETVTIDKPLTILGANDGISAGAAPGTRGAETIVEGGIQVLAGGTGSVLSGLRIEQGFDDAGLRTGILIDASDVTVRDSVIAGVGVFPAPVPGSHAARVTVNASGATISSSLIQDNAAGLRLEGVAGVGLIGNRIEGNSGTGVRALVGSSGVLLRDNQLVGNALAVAGEAATPVDAARNFWNSGETAPLENGPNGYAGNVLFSPWFADAGMQTLVDGVFTDTTVGEGETLSADVLQIADGVTLTVERGRVSANRLDLQEGGTLEVIDGDFELGVPSGGTHTIAGTFRITHSLGSIEILGDTTFSGDTLALVSDFHIADGVSLVITGSLVMDGCRLRGAGSFDMILDAGATLEMVRCEVRGASLFIVGSDLRLVDNLFHDSTGFIFSTVQGAEVFHNVFFGGLNQFTILSGATVTTDVEGWGNVTTVEEARNRLMLHWMEPVLPGRTLDPLDGTLYVQPGDAAHVEIDSGGFNGRVQAAELLLAYHSGYLALTGLTPRSPWENLLYLLDQPLSLFGKVDMAAGFGFAFEDPDGTLEDHVIGEFEFESALVEGRTLVFFREKDDNDHAQIDTRLTTSSGGTPSYLDFPFTRNSGTLVIDGTPPLIDEPTASVTQDTGSGPVDLLLAGTYTREGLVQISFAAFDELAGIDPAAVTVLFDGPQLIGATAAGTGNVTINDLSFTQYDFTLIIDGSTPDGLYDVIVTVTDRSGNTTQLLLGTVEIAKLIATVNVRSQGLVTAPITRNVTFVMTDAGGGVLETRVVAVDFTGGTGTAVLAGLPGTTANLSAKTAWTQRRRLACTFDSNGDALVDFTGSSQLPGGDLNGDNIINLADYNILNGNWFTTNPAADISGDGVVNVFDFNILNSNWFTIGDPP